MDSKVIALGLAIFLAGCGKAPEPKALSQAMSHEKTLVAAPAVVPAAEPVKPTYALPPAPVLSPKGYQEILNWEVGGGEAYFNRHLSHPTIPGVKVSGGKATGDIIGASGITVGVGYDTRFNSKSAILEDWREYIEVETLASCAGIKDEAAKTKLLQVCNLVISWSLAEKVFQKTTIARFYKLTKETFPNFDLLPANAQAALVSLVFNRGASMYGDSRKEMRAIRDLCATLNNRNSASVCQGIAAEIRAMKRLWPDTAGLQNRRDAEALLALTP